MADNLPLAFGGHFQYGNFVWHNTEEFVPEPVPVPPPGVGVSIYNSQGFLVWTFNSQDANTPFLSFKITEKKLGGIESATFEVERDFRVPYFQKMNAVFTFRSTRIGEAEVNYVPQPDDEETIKFQCKGYGQQLKEVDVTRNFSATSIEDIIKSICSVEVATTDIKYNSDLITVGAFTPSTYEIKNKKVWKVFEDMVRILNSLDPDIQYRWYINDDRFIVFNSIQTTRLDSFFEGYQFQTPVAKTRDDKLVNAVKIFRGDQATPNKLDLVGTYTDSESIDQYGRREEKITISDYADNTTIAAFGSGILNLRKDPINEITIKNIDTVERFDFGVYGTSIRPRDYYKLVSECDTLTGWTIADSNGSVVTAQDSIVFTGRQALKIEPVNGDHIEFNFNTIMNCQELRFYFRQSAASGNVTVRLYNDSQPTSIFSEVVSIAIVDQFLLYTADLSGIIANRIRFSFTGSGADIFLDRIELKNNSWSYYEEYLEKSVYSVHVDGLLADLSFGAEPDNLFSSIKDITEKNRIALDVFERET